MGIELYILKPGLTEPGAVEGAAWVTSPSEVTHFKMECEMLGGKHDDEIIENILPEHKNIQIGINKVVRQKVFVNINLGDLSEAATYKWKQALDYCWQKWKTLAAKYSKIYRYDSDGATEFTSNYIWNNGTSQFEAFQGMIKGYEAEETTPNHILIKSILLKWGGDT